MFQKFRAWSKTEKKMLKHIQEISFAYSGELIGVETESLDYHGANEIELMQSTGFEDTNGVEVFEGDILRNSNYAKTIFICKKSELQASFVAKTQSGLLVSSFWADEMRDWEVIGNVWEDRKLLEGSIND